jgi:hypothetical protein
MSTEEQQLPTSFLIAATESNEVQPIGIPRHQFSRDVIGRRAIAMLEGDSYPPSLFETRVIPADAIGGPPVADENADVLRR